MRRIPLGVLLVLLAAVMVGILFDSRNERAVQAAIPCSTATAGAPPMRSAEPSFTKLGGPPFGVATAPGYAFVTNLTGGLDVLTDRDSNPHLVRTIRLAGGRGLGMTITEDGRYLLIADGTDGAYVVDVARAESGAANAVLGTLRGGLGGANRGGAIEVAASRDGHYAFVSLEDSGQLAVYDLAAAIIGHFKEPAYVGAIPTGRVPVGLAVSRDGDWLYSTSELGGPPGARTGGRDGSLSVISMAAAERHPGQAVVATVSAGCSPLRVVVSPTGDRVWVTARGSDDLLAFSVARLVAHSSDALLATVRVGEAPVGLALVDGGSRIVVANSNRVGARGQSAGLTVVSAAAALARRAAIAGTIRSGLFPREMALEPAGGVLLVTNFGSGTLESVHIAAHAQETHLRGAKTRADD